MLKAPSFKAASAKLTELLEMHGVFVAQSVEDYQNLKHDSEQLIYEAYLLLCDFEADYEDYRDKLILSLQTDM